MATYGHEGGGGLNSDQRAAIADRAKKISGADYLIVFSGEGAGNFLCSGWEEMRKRLLAEMGVREEGGSDEESDHWFWTQNGIDDPDNWNHDEDRLPVRFEREVGEISHVSIYRLGEKITGEEVKAVRHGKVLADLLRDQMNTTQTNNAIQYFDSK